MPSSRLESTGEASILSVCEKRKVVPRRIFVFCALIVIIGCAAATAFSTLGVTSAKREQSELFERRAAELVNSIVVSLKAYEAAGLYVHNSCRDGITRQKFRELYETITSTGLDVKAVAYNPNVTHAERPAFEEEARQYYGEFYPSLNATGIKGMEVIPDSPGYAVVPSSNKSFYFPIHYIEPPLEHPNALEFDIYSSPVHKGTIDLVLTTWKPALSPPLGALTEPNPHIFDVILMHPGVPLSTQPDLTPRDISTQTIRIPDLLRNAMATQLESTVVYLFEASRRNTFLGGASAEIRQDGEVEDFTILNQTSLDDLLVSTNTKVREQNIVALSAEWTVVVVAPPGMYVPSSYVYVILGTVFVLASCLVLAIWLYTTTRQQVHTEYAESVAETEKAKIVVEEAQKSAKAARELNDFIAHEVRNPLSAAMSACNFVVSAINDMSTPLSTESDRATVRDDLDIIEKSLTFINDLLRNMLDVQRAQWNQLDVDLSPIDVLRDVLRPVDAMMYSRDGTFRVEIRCVPENLFVLTDRMRLKQVMLNMGRNSAKFVKRGFVRLCAEDVNGNVVLSIEDSGAGIPEEKKAQLFSKYQNSLDTLHQGTGIGLSLCQQIADLLKAKIWLDDSYNSGIQGCPGARFVIDLQKPPLVMKEDEDIGDALGESTVMVDDTSANGYTIKKTADQGTVTKDVEMGEPSYLSMELPDTLSVLFVDDDFILRKLFSRSVRKVKPTWNVQEASNGETALVLVDETKFDLIFLDQYMTSVEKQLLGTETARALRAKGVTARLCGLSANDMETSFLANGADAFLIKPFPCEKEALRKELLRVLYGC